MLTSADTISLLIMSLLIGLIERTAFPNSNCFLQGGGLPVSPISWHQTKKNCLALTPMRAVVLWDCFWKNVSRSSSKSKSTETLCQQKSTRKGLKYSGKCLGFRTKDFFYGTPDRGRVCECFNKKISITGKISTKSWRGAMVSKSRLV